LLQNASVFENVAFPLRIHGGRTSSRSLRAWRIAWNWWA
jgi:ABC-type ATPase involved in cell division